MYMNKQQLAAKIWASANKMRSSIEANEYKDYILGFIFYRYLSEREETFLREKDFTAETIPQYVNEDNKGTVEFIQDNLGYFIAYKDLYSTWLAKGKDFDIGDVRDALSAFERLVSPNHEDVFHNIFLTLSTGLSKLGENAKAQTKAVQDLLQLIKDIPMEQKQDYDVLGFIYEYLLSMFAANAGKKAGEFYTPHEVSLLMSEIIAWHLRNRQEIKIYDPTSGSGSLLINIGHAAAKYLGDANKIRYYAQELKQNTYNLTRMNLIMRGILPDNIVVRNGDTLSERDWPYFEGDGENWQETYEMLEVDAVVSNPPYSQPWDPTGKDTDPRYARYGMAPKSKADYAFLLHDLYHLKPDGMMNIVLPHGVLFRGGEEGEIRKNLVEANNIDAIIGLPPNIFYGTGIPTIVMVLRQKRDTSDVLIIDASKGFIKEGKNNKLRACDIRKIVDTVRNRADIPKYSRKVSKDEIRKNDYNLNIPRYVDSSTPTEPWDLYAIMNGGIPEAELALLETYWHEFPTLKEELFTTNGTYAALRSDHIRDTIRDNGDVQQFLSAYSDRFADFGDTLRHELIDQAETVSVTAAEEEITADIFRRFHDVHLIDPYEAYELFYTAYQRISGDLELIQSEGLDAAVRSVEPNMVERKKKGKAVIEQDGWMGHILPFDLVQKTYLQDQADHVAAIEQRLEDIVAERTDILENLSEDDKEAAADALNDNNDDFVKGKLGPAIKQLKVNDPVEYAELIGKLEQVKSLYAEETTTKKTAKEEALALHMATKDKIEHLTADEIQAMLYAKWITPLETAIQALPTQMLDAFMRSIEHLDEKYKVTLVDVEGDIKKTEAELRTMLPELTGSDWDMKAIAELEKLLGGD